jgi:hypothetical protein
MHIDLYAVVAYEPTLLSRTLHIQTSSPHHTLSIAQLSHLSHLACMGTRDDMGIHCQSVAGLIHIFALRITKATFLSGLRLF